MKISLIGMPSAGKTTYAIALSNALGYKLYDLDSMVEEKEGESLIAIQDTKGRPYFLDMEFGFMKDIKEDNAIISTAGSIIYHNDAMVWLSENTKIVYIDTPLHIIESRLKIKPKAVLGLKEIGLIKLAEERIPVYERYADIKIKTEDKEPEVVVQEIIDSL